MGIANFVGACMGPITLSVLKRRTQFIGGHLLLTLCLVGSALCINANLPNGTLASMSGFVLIYQIFCGGAFWVYLGEVGSEVCLGIGLFSL